MTIEVNGFSPGPCLDHGLGHAAPSRRRTRLGRAQSDPPQIYSSEDGVEKRVLNAADTEAAKDKVAKIKQAFEAWIWTDAGRADRLAKIYNERFNNLVPRRFDGSHLTLPHASSVIRFYEHQKRAIWRILSAGLDLCRSCRRRRKNLHPGRGGHRAEAPRPDHEADDDRARALPRAGCPANSCSSTRPPLTSWLPTSSIS